MNSFGVVTMRVSGTGQEKIFERLKVTISEEPRVLFQGK